MKRDMDLIRLLLLEVETGEKQEATSRYTEAEILYHCELAIEADLLVGQLVRRSQGDVVSARLERLSWAGHEFLDAARDESVWKKAKERVLKTGGSWTLDALKAVLIEIVKKGLS